MHASIRCNTTLQWYCNWPKRSNHSLLFVLLSFDLFTYCPFVILSFCPFALLPFCLFVILSFSPTPSSKCLKYLRPYQGKQIICIDLWSWIYIDLKYILRLLILNFLKKRRTQPDIFNVTNYITLNLNPLYFNYMPPYY